MPQKLRHFDFSEQQYKVWGLVRYCHQLSTQLLSNNQVGVAFIGKNPPKSYQENPTKLYDLVGFNSRGFSDISESAKISAQNEPAQDFSQIAGEIQVPHKTTRYQIPFDVLLEKIDQHQRTIIAETTVSENVSLGGAAIFSSLDVRVNDTVRVYFRAFNVAILARVRNRRTGYDGMPRLHLQFLDRQLPLEGIE